MFPLSDLFYLPLRIRKLKAPSPDRRFFLGSRILLRTFHSGVTRNYGFRMSQLWITAIAADKAAPATTKMTILQRI